MSAFILRIASRQKFKSDIQRMGESLMKLQQIVRYRLDFESKALTASGALMGAAFFLQSVYFFGVADLQQVGIGQLIFQLSLPVLIEASWFLLLRGFQFPIPMLYGMLGAGYCLILMVQTVAYGGVAAAIVAVPSCIVSALGLLAVTGGYVASRFVAVAALILTIVLRLIFGGIPEGVLELAALCGFAGMMVLFAAMKDPRKIK